MANRFEVQVVALDRFTKTFRSLNDRASKAVRPLTNVQRQVGALSRELHLDKIAKGMGKVSQASLTVARNLGLATGPIESLLGMGVAGGIVGLTASVAALGARWGMLGYEVNRTSQRIGVSTDDLQRYRAAAGRAGVSSDAFTSALGTLGETLQDALYGRNPQALIILNKLGIGIKRNAAGVVDSVAAFRDLSLALSRIADPRVQAIVARAFGMEEALPLLRQGPEAIERLAREAEKAGQVMGGEAVAGAMKFGDALNRLKAAAEGAANATGAKLTGPFTRAMDFISSAMEGSIHPKSIGEAMSNAAGAVFGGPRFLRNVFGGGSDRSKQRSGGAVTEPAGSAQVSQWQIDPAVQAERDRDALKIKRAELERETDPGTRAALQREIGRDETRLSSGAAEQQPVHVVIDMKNVQPGVSVQAKQGNTFLPTRISYSMPTTVTP